MALLEFRPALFYTRFFEKNQRNYVGAVTGPERDPLSGQAGGLQESASSLKVFLNMFGLMKIREDRAIRNNRVSKVLRYVECL